MDHIGQHIIVGGFSAMAGAVVVALWRAYLTEGRLLGTWQSDGERTVNEWRERRPMTDEQTAALRKLFGHMRITWGRRKYVTEMDGRREELPYRVIAKDEKSAVLRAGNPLDGKEEFVQVNFEDTDTYWLYADGGPLREYFRRVQ